MTEGQTFRGVDWYGEDLGSRAFVSCEFVDADLTEATSRGARFEGCTFLGGAMIRGAAAELSPRPTPEELRQFVAERIAAYKEPEHITFMDELPSTRPARSTPRSSTRWCGNNSRDRWSLVPTLRVGTHARDALRPVSGTD